MRLSIKTSLAYFITSTAVAVTPHDFQPIPIAIGFMAVILIVGLTEIKE